MQARDITQQRLLNQQIVTGSAATALDIVTSLGALQAQDFSGALWSIGLRIMDGREAEVKKAIAARTILRTWPMRGTLHIIPASDAHWMTALLTPRIIKANASRYRQLGLDDAVFKKGRKIFEKALHGGRHLRRDEMYDLLEKSGLSPQGQRGIHIICRLAMEGLLCFGEHEGNQPTFVLLDEWVIRPAKFSREEGLDTLVKRYFSSHGPATIQDFAWWSGLKLSDARAATEALSETLHQEVVDGQTYYMTVSLPENSQSKSDIHLLPGFDEYMLGYTDRTHALDSEYAARIVPSNNGVFMPTIVHKGNIIGTWKRTLKKNSVTLALEFFRPVSKAIVKAANVEASKFARYLGLSLAAVSADISK